MGNARAGMYWHECAPQENTFKTKVLLHLFAVALWFDLLITLTTGMLNNCFYETYLPCKLFTQQCVCHLRESPRKMKSCLNLFLFIYIYLKALYYYRK